MDSAVSSTVRRMLALGAGVVAVVVLGAGTVVPLLVFEDVVLAASVGAAAAVAAVFVASSLLTLAAVWWAALPGEVDADDVHGPRVLPVRKKAGLTPDAARHLLSALEPRAQQALVAKRVRSTGAPQRNTIYSSTPTRTYFVELGDPNGQLPAVYASLTKEGMHDIFEVPSRQRARESYEALAMQAGQLPEPVMTPFADVTLVCGVREAALVDPSVPLAKLEHPDLREEWWATPGFLDLFDGVPTERLVDVLNEYAVPGLGARVNEGWAAAWVVSPEPRSRRIELLGHALMHLTSLPQDYEYLYGRSSEGTGSDPVTRTLRSDTIARAAATRRDVLGVIATLATGSIALAASLGAGPTHWAGDFWVAAVAQAGVLVMVGIVVLVARPDHVTRQRRAGKQVIELANAHEWQVRRNVPDVGHIFPRFPFAAVTHLGASPIAQPVPAPEDAEADPGAGAAYLYGDIGPWPRRRPFAARAVWVVADAQLPSIDVVDRTMPSRVARTMVGERVRVDAAQLNERWHVSAPASHTKQVALGARAIALLDELPPGPIAVQAAGNTVMVWDPAAAREVDLAERHRWATRFAHALAH